MAPIRSGRHGSDPSTGRSRSERGGGEGGAAGAGSAGTRRPARSARWLCGLVLAVLVVDVMARHVVELVALACVGLVVTAAGAWWAVTERRPRRAIGIAGATLGIGGVVAAVGWPRPG